MWEIRGESIDIMQQAREEYRRYFGICSSYQHLKACICKNCPSYSGAGMFCSRSKYLGQGKKQGYFCETCELFRKFQLEGGYFCLQVEKLEFSEEKPEFSLKNYRKLLSAMGRQGFVQWNNPIWKRSNLNNLEFSSKILIKTIKFLFLLTKIEISVI